MIMQTGRMYLGRIHIKIRAAKTIWEIPAFHVLQQGDGVRNGTKHPKLTCYTV